MHGDTIFIEALSTEGTIRLSLPPRVADVIARQREALSTRRRSAGPSRARAEADRARGVVPGFLRKKRGAA